MNKTFTHEITWLSPDLNLRQQIIQYKWNDLATSAIIEGFNPFLFEHSDITKSLTLISVSAYKSTPWFVRILYFLCPRGGFSFPSWGRRWTK